MKSNQDIPPLPDTIIWDKGELVYEHVPVLKFFDWNVHRLCKHQGAVYISGHDISEICHGGDFRRVQSLWGEKPSEDIAKFIAWPVDAFEFHNLIIGETKESVEVQRYAIVSQNFPDRFFFHSEPFSGKLKNTQWFTSPKIINLIPKDCIPNSKSKMIMLYKLAKVLAWLESKELVHFTFAEDTCLDAESDDIYVSGFMNIYNTRLSEPVDSLWSYEYMPPEVVIAGRYMPTISTLYGQRHALSVLIYQLLLLRHPLRGMKMNSTISAEEDDRLSMGECALFIEHPTDASNRTDPRTGEVKLIKSSYNDFGHDIAELFERAFIDGLHNPNLRPTPSEWASAFERLINTELPLRLRD